MAGGNRPIEFTFVADVAKYLREVKKMEVSTEDIEDALVGVTNSADDLERKLSKAMRDAAKDTEVLERAIKDLPDATDGAAKKMGADFHHIGDDAEEAGREVGSEFKQNLGESLASGDISTILQDTAGGLVSGLSGPLAVAAAAFAGIAAFGFSKFQEQAAQAAQLAETYAGQMRERLGMIQGEIDKAFTTQQMQEFVKENLDFFQSINDELELAGINANDYVTAMYEGGQPLADMESKLRSQRDLHREIVTEGGRTKVVYDDVGDALGDLITSMGSLKETQKDANAEARTWDSIFGHSADTVKNLKADVKSVTELFNKKYTLDVRANMTSQQLAAAFPYGIGGGTSGYATRSTAGGSG